MTAPDDALLALDRVTRRFGGVLALDEVSLDIARGRIVCLVGHSGCGKSTLLRTIAGVEAIDSGRIRLNGELVCGEGTFVEPEQRRVGFMFQDYALFPHLTVRQNIGFGLGQVPRTSRRARVDEIIDRIGIRALADRFPHMLSGGEQQRVALARALAPQPSVLLMDEPFSNLDRGLRDEVRRETLALVRGTGTTAVIVTHDPEEALAIGDIVALMQRGRLVEVGTPDAIYNSPRTPYAAAFFSVINRVPARRDNGRLETALGHFPLPAGVEGDLVAYIRPQAIRLAASGISARVLTRAVLGEVEELHLAVAGLAQPVVMRSTERHAVQEGELVWLNVNSGDAMIFAEGPGQAYT